MNIATTNGKHIISLETLRHSEDLPVDLHVVEAVRADIRSAHERSAALRAEALLLAVGYRLGLRGIL